jgi:hypothetical protein
MAPRLVQIYDVPHVRSNRILLQASTMKSPALRCVVVFITCILTYPAAAQDTVSSVRPISTITDGFQARYNTIAHALLNNEAATSLVTQGMYDFLDGLIDEARQRIVKKSSYTRDDVITALHTIDEILIGRNVLYPADSAGMGLVHQLSDGLRSRVMNSNEIDALVGNPHNMRRADWIRSHAREPFFVNDCDTTSFLYLAIAEVMDLPIFMVEIPGHNFIRYQNNGDSLDWETMDGRIAPPGY